LQIWNRLENIENRIKKAKPEVRRHRTDADHLQQAKRRQALIELEFLRGAAANSRISRKEYAQRLMLMFPSESKRAVARASGLSRPVIDKLRAELEQQGLLPLSQDAEIKNLPPRQTEAEDVISRDFRKAA
jgi:hypothetical protein